VASGWAPLTIDRVGKASESTARVLEPAEYRRAIPLAEQLYGTYLKERAAEEGR
jgi:hypothetical protein